MKKEEITKAIQQIRASLEILLAVNTLEYYDMNWLSQTKQNPRAWNRDQNDQIENAIWNLKKLYPLID